MVTLCLTVTQLLLSGNFRQLDSLESRRALINRVSNLSTSLAIESVKRIDGSAKVDQNDPGDRLFRQDVALLKARLTAISKGSSALSITKIDASDPSSKPVINLVHNCELLIELCQIERSGSRSPLLKNQIFDRMKEVDSALDETLVLTSDGVGRLQGQLYATSLGGFLSVFAVLLLTSTFAFRPMFARLNEAYRYFEGQNQDLEDLNIQLKGQQNILVERNLDLTKLQELQEEQAKELRENAEKLGRALEHSQQASQVARFSASRFQDLFQGIPVPAFTFDPQGTIYEWNKAVGSLFGMQGFEVFQQSIFGRVFREDERTEIESVITKVFAGETIQNWEREDSEHGRRRFLLLNFFPLRNPLNEVVGGVCAAVDITERKLVEEQLLAYQEQIKEQMGYITEQNILLQVKQQELESANERLEALATKDGLTGLFNHRAFQDELEEWFLAFKGGHPLSLILMDVDHFKGLNDQYGHQVGDEVLRRVAQLLGDHAREDEFVCRYGGEEFAVILPGKSIAEARTAAERFRRSIESADWPHRAVTASFGVAEASAQLVNRANLISLADQALYAAKSAGRNCVKVFDGDSASEFSRAS